LLDHLAERCGLTGRLPRVVLVPFGVLGRVPWHAAAAVVDGRRRHAVERAVFSYAVSARMFCDVVFSPDIERGTGGLVVGDPGAGTSSLLGARREAQAIRRAFLPDATYLGRADGYTRCAGPGKVDEVTDWLADDRPSAGAVLHAACHGTVRPGHGARPTSFLQLADGPLAAEALIASLAARPSRGLALAVLAACSSGVPGRGHDEAFSVATALLAAGTRSVVSSLWTVPDTATSVLMYLFHHYLRDHPPVDALHAAQLWMLDPGAAAPESMPEHLLTGRDASAILAWAGFTHAGR
jgi:CHAT domain-containing protein